MSEPILIDTADFSRKACVLAGEVVLAQLDERVSRHELVASADTPFSYRVAGGVDEYGRPYLDVSVSGAVSLFCQRCLQPVGYDVDDASRVVFFPSEEEADRALDEECEFEAAVFEAQTDVRVLLEDQILMALPVAPRHGDCDAADYTTAGGGRENPFAKLAGIKKEA